MFEATKPLRVTECWPAWEDPAYGGELSLQGPISILLRGQGGRDLAFQELTGAFVGIAEISVKKYDGVGVFMTRQRARNVKFSLHNGLEYIYD